MDVDKVIKAARGWLGTKFHHQGRLKNIGVDCIGLIVGVGRELGYEVIDKTNYPRVPQNGELQKEVEKYLIKSTLVPGCIALFKLEDEPQHVGIIGEYERGGLSLIHAYLQARKVVEHNLDDNWKNKIVATYSFPPK